MLLVLAGNLAAPIRFSFLGILFLAVICALLLSFAYAQKRLTLFFFLVALAAGGALVTELSCYRHVEAPALAVSAAGKDAEISGVIEKIDFADEDSATFTLRTASVRGAACEVRLSAYYPAYETSAEIRAGDKVSGRVTLYVPHNDLYGADRVNYLKSDGVFLCATLAEDAMFTKSGTEKTPPFWVSLRESASAALENAKSAGILRAVLLGDREGMPASLSDALRKTGTSHLFALSGLHLSLIVVSLFTFLRFLTVRLQVNVLLTSSFCVLYVLVCGAPLSLLRAGGMLLLYYLSLLLRRRATHVQNLFCAMALIVLIDRYALYDTALQLSFLATLGVLLCLPRIEAGFASRPFYMRQKARRRTAILAAVLRFCLLSFSTTLCALFFSFPVLAANFGAVPLFAPLFNLVLVALFRPALICAALLMTAGLLRLPFLAQVLGALTDFCFSAIMDITLFFSRLNPLSIFVATPYLPAVLVVMALCVFFCLYFQVRTRALFLAVPICVGAFFTVGGVYALTCRTQQILVMTNYYDDQHLLYKSAEATVLFEGALPREEITFPLLYSVLTGTQTAEIDALVLCAVGDGTANSVAAFLDKVPAARVLAPAPARLAKPAACEMLRAACASHNAALSYYEAGQPLVFGALQAEAHHTRYACKYRITVNETPVCYGHNIDADEDCEVLLLTGKSRALHPARVVAAPDAPIDTETLRVVQVRFGSGGALSPSY